MDLAAAWENQLPIRNRSRDTGALTAGPSVDQTGCPSVKAMVLFLHALETMASWWVSKTNEPKPIPIQDIRDQAFCSSKLLVFQKCMARRLISTIQSSSGSTYVVKTGNSLYSNPLRLNTLHMGPQNRKIHY